MKRIPVVLALLMLVAAGGVVAARSGVFTRSKKKALTPNEVRSYVAHGTSSTGKLKDGNLVTTLRFTRYFDGASASWRDDVEMLDPAGAVTRTQTILYIKDKGLIYVHPDRLEVAAAWHDPDTSREARLLAAGAGEDTAFGVRGFRKTSDTSDMLEVPNLLLALKHKTIDGETVTIREVTDLQFVAVDPSLFEIPSRPVKFSGLESRAITAASLRSPGAEQLKADAAKARAAFGVPQ